MFGSAEIKVDKVEGLYLTMTVSAASARTVHFDAFVISSSIKHCRAPSYLQVHYCFWKDSPPVTGKKINVKCAWIRVHSGGTPHPKYWLVGSRRRVYEFGAGIRPLRAIGLWKSLNDDF
jgi:hypothetical protein